jgi:hypothetical protein
LGAALLASSEGGAETLSAEAVGEQAAAHA